MEVRYQKKLIQLPDILIAGVAKGGTTTLAHWLSQHHNVYCPRKEPGFLAYSNCESAEIPSAIRERQLTTIEDIQKLYANANGRKILDASVACFTKVDLTVDNLKRLYGEALPALKVVVVLRQPVERAFSNYMMLVKNGHESLPFEEAISEDVVQRRLSERAGFDYLGNSLYTSRVEALQNAGVQLEVLLAKDIKSPEKAYRRLLDFCELPYQSVDIHSRMNTSGSPKSKWLYNALRGNRGFNAWVRRSVPERWAHSLKSAKSVVLSSQLKRVALPPEQKKALTVQFIPDIQRTSRLIGRDLSHWYE